MVDSQDSWKIEELETEQRDSDKDSLLLQDTCSEIKKNMQEILLLKTQENGEEDISEKRIKISLFFATLKKLNRLEKLRSKNARDATNEAKQRVDSFQLQLQNLLYESLHLKKEVDKCLEFKSKDDDLELVSTEEFYREAPTSISKPELTKKDSHQQMLARLDWELEQRKQLAEKCKAAQALKEKLVADIKTKREYLENLSPRLNSILQATRPLQDYLDMPLEARHAQHKAARYLPVPLHILYAQASAYSEACDKAVSITVEGDVDEARAVKDEEAEDDNDSGDSDVEEERHRVRSVDRLANSRKKLLEIHPLSVKMVISDLTTHPGKGGNSIILCFLYLTKLHIVTVKCELSILSTETVPGDVLSSSNVLTCLFCDDYGNQTPNPANHYQLKKLGMEEFSSYINDLGRPYLWVQRLAGLEFLTQDLHADRSSPYLQQTLKPETAVSSSHIAQTITAIRERFQVRLALNQQLAAVGKGVVPVSPNSVGLFPPKISARLTNLKVIPVEDVMSGEYQFSINPLRDNGFLTEAHKTFLVDIERGSAKLKVLVIISPDYPHTPSIFKLKIAWKGGNSTDNEESLRAVERELNVFCDELVTPKTKDQLLTNQLQRLLTCWDVYLETETSSQPLEGPVEHSKEKTFLRPFQGRDRIKPYNYNSKYGLFSPR